MLPGITPSISAGGRTLGSLIAGGTNIGNMTANGGLVAAYDGTTSQSGGASATRASGSTTAFVGKTPASSVRVFKATCYGANNQGYINSADPSTTLEFRGHSSAPTTGAEGTLLGSVTFTDTATTNSQEITSSDKETLWAHVWVRIVPASGTPEMHMAELQMYEAV